MINSGVCCALICAGVIACGPSPRAPGDGCVEDVRRCNGTQLETCSGGQFVATEACAAACDPDMGCVACQPGTGTCDGEVSHACLPDGSAIVDVTCDPVQGMTCNPGTGSCEGVCAPQNLGKSYLGCEYYATITANPVDSNFHFAVAIANSTAEFADVVIEGGGSTAVQSVSIAPFGVEVRALSWVEPLKACTSLGEPLGCGYLTVPAALATGGAYRIRSNQPVTVYQFNPLEFQIGTQRSFSNDASLLAPVTAMSNRYIAVAWPAWDSGGVWPGLSPGLLAVTATADATEVTVTTTANTVAASGAPAFAAGVPQTITLQRGDVLQVTADSGDLTGSRVVATHPVQVIAGHYCTEVPFGVGNCDHLEESMFPIETLGDDYLVVAPAVPALPDGKPQIVRIIAIEPATTLTFDPPQDAPTSIAEAGGIVELPATAASFRVTANHRILVAQYMQGVNAGGQSGDPSMSLVVATKQFRTDYFFHVPASYLTSYINVVAPTSAAVELDGMPLQGFVPLGSSGFGVLHLELASGNHTVTADAPVGISVYGYGPATSYWYPAGLDLEPLTIL